MKLSVTFHNLVNVPKNGDIFYSQKSIKELFQLWQKKKFALELVYMRFWQNSKCADENIWQVGQQQQQQKICSISSVRTVPMNHNLVLASPQLFLSPYVLSHP